MKIVKSPLEMFERNFGTLPSFEFELLLIAARKCAVVFAQKRAGIRQVLASGSINEPSYERTSERLNEVRRDLHKRNRSAAQPLEEGVDETLLLHRLGMTEFSTTFATTNCIESVNAHLERTTRKVKHWQNRHNVLAGLLLV